MCRQRVIDRRCDIGRGIFVLSSRLRYCTGRKFPGDLLIEQPTIFDLVSPFLSIATRVVPSGTLFRQ
jgi:hypothetical protein